MDDKPVTMWEQIKVSFDGKAIGYAKLQGVRPFPMDVLLSGGIDPERLEAFREQWERMGEEATISLKIEEPTPIFTDLQEENARLRKELERIKEETKWGGHPTVEWCYLVAESALE